MAADSSNATMFNAQLFSMQNNIFLDILIHILIYYLILLRVCTYRTTALFHRSEKLLFCKIAYGIIVSTWGTISSFSEIMLKWERTDTGSKWKKQIFVKL
jgi:uncharacterized membrane protein